MQITDTDMPNSWILDLIPMQNIILPSLDHKINFETDSGPSLLALMEVGKIFFIPSSSIVIEFFVNIIIRIV